jgi:hypothetical protein
VPPQQTTRVPDHAVPDWVTAGTTAYDPLEQRGGVVQFIGEWEDPATRAVTPNAVFLRPERGGTEWIVKSPGSLCRP